MKGRILYSSLLFLACLVGASTYSLGQTVTLTGPFPSGNCPGGIVAVYYESSGTFGAGNVFKVQLSDAAGSFTIFTDLNPTNSAANGFINAVIPPSTPAGTNYYVRVVSTNPVRLSAPTRIVIPASPSAPTLKSSTPLTYCEGVTPPSLALNVTFANGATPKWSPSEFPNTNKTGSNQVYQVSQILNGCESPTADIIVTVSAKPSAPGVSSVTYCVGQTANTLSATVANGAVLNWYTLSSGGTASSFSPKPSTTTVGNTTYYVSQTVGGCESSRAALTVTVTNPPPAPSVTSSYTYCEGATPVAFNAVPSGGGILRYTPSASPDTKKVGPTLYYVSQSVGGCESATATITVNVKDAPDAPTTSPLTYCAGQQASALTATPTAGATLNWYTSATAAASPNSFTPSTSSTGVANYYVSQTLNGCESPKATITVTTKTKLDPPGVTSVLSACQNRTGYALTATPSANASLNWYGTAASGGTATSTPVALSTTTTGSTTYYVSQSLNGCESDRAAIQVTINAVPAAPTFSTPAPYCQGTTAAPLSATGTMLHWFGASQTGVAFSSAATTPNTSVIGTTTYYVTQTVSGCESERAGIPVQIKATPGAPSVSNIDFCQGTSIPTLTAGLVSTATPNWYGTSATGGIASATAPSLTNTAVGTTVYYVSQSLNGCESTRAGISVRIKAIPAAPGVNSVSFCNNSAASQLSASGSNLKWYDSSDKLLGSSVSPSTGSVGDQTYKVSQTSGEGCESAKANLTVTIKPLPSAPGVNDVSYCQIQQDQPAQTISALSANGQSLRWFTASNTVLSGAPTPSNTQAGDQIYKVSQTVNGCEGGQATIKVSINTSAAPTVQKSLVTYCLNDNATALVATGDNGGQLRWFDPYNRLTNDAPTPSTLNTNVTPGGDAFYVYQIGANGCYSARSTIRVVVTTPPTLALAAPTASVNLGQRVPLQLKFTSVGPYSYTLTGGYTGTSQKADTTISVLPRGNTIYQIVNVSNGCGVGLPGNPATAQVTVRVPTISTSPITNATLCSGTTLSAPFTTTGDFNSGNTFRMELVSIADTTKKYDVQAKANTSPVTATLPTTVPGGQYYVRVKADNPEVAITGSNSPTTLIVRSVASATLTGSQTIYEGIPASLTVTFTGDGPWTTTYADSLRAYSATTTNNPYIVDARPSRTTTYRLVSVTNSCGNGSVSGIATVTVSPLLAVDDDPLSPLIKTYPVPTTSVLTVELNLPLVREPATLFLTDVNGRAVLQHSTRNQLNEVDLTAQPNGLYFLRIQVGDRQTVRKVLKQ